MDTEVSSLCCGCLCAGRKLQPLDEFWKRQCFLQIINEIPMSQPDRIAVLICWECEALIARFIKFKRQVKQSYKTLQHYLKQNLNTNKIQSQPKLRTHNIINITLPVLKPSNGSIIKEETLKNETDPPLTESNKIDVKEELDFSLYSDHYSDDDKSLFEISKKSKKVHNGRTKKKKKRKVKELFKEVTLDNEELMEERRLLRLRDEYVNAMFCCEMCIVSFPNVDDLKDHISIKHEKNADYLKCNICQCSFSSEVSYNYHTNKHTRRYQCEECDARFTSKRAVLKHCGTEHYTSINEEHIAQYKQNVNGSIDSTKDSDNSAKPDTPSFPCELCEKTFRWKTSLRKHVETHRIENGQKRKPYCEPCCLTFTTTSNLQKHVKTSSKHQIQLKLRKLNDSHPEDGASLEKHQARIEQIKCSINSSREQFPCPQCDKKFQWRGNLLRHLHSHAARANGELVCEPCNRTFSSIATYKQHMAISKKHVTENELNYVCGDCGKKFANKTRLRDHVNWEHLKNYVHTCPVCKKVFKTHTSLYLHKQVVHKKDSAQHLCDHCGKPFPNKAKLRSHITAIHSGSTPYACGACAARFSWHSCLSRHVRRVHHAARKRHATRAEVQG